MRGKRVSIEEAFLAENAVIARRKAWKKQRKIERAEKQLALRILVLEHYGNKCAKCGKALENVWGIYKGDSKLSRSAARVVEENFPDTYQVICNDCQFKQGG